MVYLDTSAAVKLVVDERESAALGAWLERADHWVSSEILEVELRCAVRRTRGPAQRLEATLDAVELVRFAPAIRQRAGQPFDPPQRALDAIHLATAQTFALRALILVSYDQRQLEAARVLGLQTATPA